jgi:hypothetical protein
MKLKTGQATKKMSRDELIIYIDELHSALLRYQLVIDQAVSKNQNHHV